MGARSREPRAKIFARSANILVPLPTVLTLIDAGRINLEFIRTLGFFYRKIQVENK
jgi:hypothetical protein